MALSVRQILVSSRTSATSITRTYASAVLSGSLLVAHGAVFNSGGSGEPTISDTVNGSWTGYSTTGYFVSGDADSEIYLWSKPNSGAGTPGVTMNPPGTASDNDLTLFEITGAATSTPRDVSVTATGAISTGVGSSAVATGTLAQANEILVSSVSHTVDDRTLTTDTADGFTQADENESNSSGQTYHVQYKIVAATTSVTANVSWNSGVAFGTWFAGVASFKESGAAPVTPKQLALLGVGA